MPPFPTGSSGNFSVANRFDVVGASSKTARGTKPSDRSHDALGQQIHAMIRLRKESIKFPPMHDPYEFDFVAVDEHADTIVANTNSIEPVNSADLLEIADF